MKRLLFIRHGEPEMAGTFCGHSDPHLNAAGRLQASTLAGIQVDVVLSSDLKRAIETAEAVAPAVPHRSLPALREIDFGAWEGLRWAEIEALDPAYAARWVAEFPAITPPQGEPFAHFRRRIMEAITSLLADDRWEHAAVVTHAGVMRLVLEELAGKTPEQAWEITRLYCSSFLYPEVQR